ncbi:MAG: YdjY domain-containing protein [Phycisphaerae bacterium]|nr:YdjY domain-containing protein [Phycisphaerae bacterium]
MKRLLLVAIMAISLFVVGVAAESKESRKSTGAAEVRSPASGSPKAASGKNTKGIIRFPHLVIDRKARELRLEATVVKAEYMLEFLLCTAGGKEYESLMSTKAKPWQVHAGLLALGLHPGKPGGYAGDTYVPPRGAGLNIVLKWKDKKTGQPQTATATDWLKLSGKGAKKVKPKKWIFVGSEVMPDGSYWADSTGEIIAVANLASAVIDVPMESTKALKHREFVVNAKAVPPVGTKVQIVISPCRGAANAPHARSFLDIDPLGRMIIDGKKIEMPNLRRWAGDYMKKHNEGMVVIRSAAKALCCYGPIAAMELKLGGVFDMEFVTMELESPLLPRTPQQAKAALEDWKSRFANPQDQLRDPGKEVQATLREIQRRRAELKRLDGLLVGYDKSLREALEAYNKTPRKRPMHFDEVEK